MTRETTRSLSALCADLAIDDGAALARVSELILTDIALDSRRVVRGGLFLACAGRRTHGLAALPQALAAGAKAVLWEPAAGVSPPAAVSGVFMQPVPQLSQQASRLAARFFDDPSATLAVAGITGTNGKTTSAWLLAQAWASASGLRAAYIGTLGVGEVTGALTPSDYTTSDAVSVQRQLAELRDAGFHAVAMEVSSHALDQHRVAAVRFRAAGFTNLTRDHLDYHGSMEAYGAAKARLFDMPDLAGRVINVDDAFGVELAARYASTDRLVQTSRQQVSNVRRTAQGLQFRLTWHKEHEVTVPLVGEFNLDNVLTVIGLLEVQGIEPAAAVKALRNVTAPPGRMEAIVAPGRPLAIIDYAHTPDALAKALRASRGHCSGRLHVVFGCGGDRDRGKRPLMAAVAAGMADEIIVTDDNPRTEPPAGIVADILAGLPSAIHAQVIHDRASAIRTALESAKAGDAVLIAGKGHEDYQIVGEQRLPFSDRQFVRALYAEVAA